MRISLHPSGYDDRGGKRNGVSCFLPHPSSVPLGTEPTFPLKKGKALCYNSAKILEQKQQTINEIEESIKNSSAVVFFDYRGLSVEAMTSLRRKLKEAGSELKVYKNTLTRRALNTLNISLDDELVGPKAMAYGTDAVAPVKVLADFAKENEALQLKVGIIDGEIADIDMLNKLATIPSREGLLTMLAGGLIGIAKDLSICLDLYSQQLEGNEQ